MITKYLPVGGSWAQTRATDFGFGEIKMFRNQFENQVKARYCVLLPLASKVSVMGILCCVTEQPININSDRAGVWAPARSDRQLCYIPPHGVSKGAQSIWRGSRGQRPLARHSSRKSSRCGANTSSTAPDSRQRVPCSTPDSKVMVSPRRTTTFSPPMVNSNAPEST